MFPVRSAAKGIREVEPVTVQASSPSNFFAAAPPHFPFPINQILLTSTDQAPSRHLDTKKKLTHLFPHTHVHKRIKTTNSKEKERNTMTTTTTHLRSLYRRLLRELPSTPQSTRTQHQKLSSPSHLQRHIRTALSSAPPTASSSSSSSPTQATPPQPPARPSQLDHAEQFVGYVQAQRSYAALLERYNPGMGMTEEERVRLSARRVGMNLPVEFEEGVGEKTG